MRKMDLRKISRKKSEKGIAIIFVLGILGLLMVIGLGFAASSMLDSKLASNSVNSSNAQNFARSAFERAFLLLKNGTSPKKIVSRISGGSGGDFDHLWKLDTLSESKVEIVDLGQGSYDPADTALPVWQYIKVDGKILGRFAYMCYDAGGILDPSVHFGRLLADPTVEAGKLPRFGTYEGEIDFREAVDSTATGNEYLTPANLKTFSDNAFDRLRKITLKEEKDLSGQQYLQDFTRPYRFPAMPDFFAGSKFMEPAGGNLDKYNGVQIFGKLMEPLYYPAPESFWIDVNGNGKQTKDEFFHRFNLARTDWDEEKFDDVHELFGVEKGTAMPNEAKDNAKSYSTAFNSTLKSGIQWLGPGGTDADVQNKSSWNDAIRRRQVAANIIQYCRKGNSVTVSDVDWTAGNIKEDAATAANAGGFLAADPSYAGNGKHPLLNEAALKLNILATVQEEDITNGAGTPRYKYTWNYTPEVKIGAEAIDIFGLSAAVRKNIRIYLKGKVEFEYATPDPDTPEGELFITDAGGVKNYGTFTHDIDFETYHEITQDAWNNGYTLETSFFRDVDPSAIPKAEGSFEKDGDSSAVRTEINKRLRIRNVKLKIEKLVLKHQDSDNTYRSRDFAKLDWEKKTLENSELPLPPDTQRFFWIGVQAQDPRVNHYKEDWGRIFSGKTSDNILDDTGDLEMKESDEFPADTAVGGTPGKVNKISVSDFGNVDSEADLSNPAASGDNAPSLSTAYIAQRPMRSLWELGTISRAEVFRTINLTRTRPFVSGENRSGNKDHYLFRESDDYESGDGNILDQVKIHVVSNSSNTDLEKFQTDRPYSFGKVNINSSRHGVLRALFANVNFVKDKNGYTFFNPVNSETPPEEESAPLTLASCTSDNSDCLICRIIKRVSGKEALQRKYMTRSDILTDADVCSKLVEGASNDAEKEQLIGKTINLMTADPPERVYIVAIGQTIQEAQAGTHFVDWDRDGEVTGNYTHAAGDSPDDNDNTKALFKAFRKAGFIRGASLRERLRLGNSRKYTYFPGVSTSLQEKDLAKVAGTYLNGVDKITGTSKLVVVLDWDPAECKWKVRSMTYGE